MYVYSICIKTVVTAALLMIKSLGISLIMHITSKYMYTDVRNVIFALKS